MSTRKGQFRPAIQCGLLAAAKAVIIRSRRDENQITSSGGRSDRGKLDCVGKFPFITNSLKCGTRGVGHTITSVSRSSGMSTGSLLYIVDRLE